MMGIPCSMEELYAGDNWEAERARAAMAARRASKGAVADVHQGSQGANALAAHGRRDPVALAMSK